MRIRALRDLPPDRRRAFVLYWMTAARRTRWNFALDRAVELARELGKPLVVLEALRADYPYACDRFHRFVIDGMRANERAFGGTSVRYHPFVETRVGAGKGLLRALAAEACAVVTDDAPFFFLPRMLARASEEVRIRFEAVDSNGILPVRATPKAFARAHDFRRFLQRELRPHLASFPRENALARVELPKLRALPRGVEKRWPRADERLLAADSAALAEIPIDHAIAPVDVEGGSEAGERALRRFVERRLARYGEDRNDPDVDGSSGLSPYLHFGHVSAHQIFARAARDAGWSPADVADTTDGSREGWWGLDSAREAFLDQLVTWRELGLNACVHERDATAYASIPAWARSTLAAHADDPRSEVYTRAEFENAETRDELWNAAQNQLRSSGRMHNYLRMLWGKSILKWSPSPRAAHATLFELNDKYALDGRDPNSATGILWTLGKYDRAWGPERPIFGTVRYMSSESTRRKLRVGDYVRRWNAAGTPSTRRKRSPTRSKTKG